MKRGMRGCPKVTRLHVPQCNRLLWQLLASTSKLWSRPLSDEGLGFGHKLLRCDMPHCHSGARVVYYRHGILL